MVERTTTGFGNRVTYAGMDTRTGGPEKLSRAPMAGGSTGAKSTATIRRPLGTPLMPPPIRCLCFQRRARNLWIAS